jgi:hypothetical protein
MGAGSAKMKSATLIVLVETLALLLIIVDVKGQEPKIAPEWKRHFKTTTVVENCIVERTMPPITEGKFPRKGQTNLYQFKCQENAFLVRQIPDLNSASSNHIPASGICAGYFGTNCWAVEAGHTLKLFPNGHELLRRDLYIDGNVMFTAERMLFSVVYYGINFIDPATVEWPEELKFTARSVLGDKYVGEISAISNKLPMVLHWHVERRPERQFVVEYKYDAHFDIPYFPSEIRLSNKAGNTNTYGAVYKVMTLRTSPTPLSEDVFDYKHYFTNSFSSPTTMVIVFTNGEAHRLTPGGHLQKVLPMSSYESDTPSRLRRHPNALRIILLALSLLSAIGILCISRKKRSSSQR